MVIVMLQQYVMQYTQRQVLKQVFSRLKHWYGIKKKKPDNGLHNIMVLVLDFHIILYTILIWKVF